MFRKILPVLYILVIVMVLAVPALSDNPPQISLTKSLSSSSVKVNESITVTIRVENTGSNDAKNIIIVDTVRDEFESDRGQTVNFPPIPTLKPKEYKEFPYTIKAKATAYPNAKEGFTIPDATATYRDVGGNTYTISSKMTQLIDVYPETPGFEAVIAGVGILMGLVLRRK